MSESSANSYEPNKPVSNRRFRVPSNPWLPYIGDCKALDKYLKSKQGVGWIIPKYLNALLRGISQVALANNPLAGLVILIALLWSNLVVGLAAVVAATTALLTSVLMRQHGDTIAAGLTCYNAVLVGTVTSSLWTPLYGEVLGVKLWCFIVVGAILSVFVTSALSNILSSLKVPLPALTIPFNVIVMLLFICLMPKAGVPGESVSSDPVAFRLQHTLPGVIPKENQISEVADYDFPMSKSTSRERRKAEDQSNVPNTDTNLDDNSDGEILNWGKILRGIIISGGQVYGVDDEISSILIYIGILVYSPILFMMSVFGAILGTICGIFFTAAPYEAVYNGIWGYNGVLSAGSVGGFFIVLTCHSFWNAMANVIFTVLIQQAMFVALNPVHLPVFTLPFVLSTLLFLSVTTSGNQMPRVTNITFPEMHRYYYREACRLKRQDKLSKEAAVVADEIAEEKELVLTDVKVVSEDAASVASVEDDTERTNVEGDVEKTMTSDDKGNASD